jgi:hypothetical protein
MYDAILISIIFYSSWIKVRNPQPKLEEQGKLYFLPDLTITDFRMNTCFFDEERPDLIPISPFKINHGDLPICA